MCDYAHSSWKVLGPLIARNASENGKVMKAPSHTIMKGWMRQWYGQCERGFEDLDDVTLERVQKATNIDCEAQEKEEGVELPVVCTEASAQSLVGVNYRKLARLFEDCRTPDGRRTIHHQRIL